MNCKFEIVNCKFVNDNCKDYNRKKIKTTGGNKRYIPAGGEARACWFAVPIKFVTAESEAVSNAARNIPPPLPPMQIYSIGECIYNQISNENIREKFENHLRFENAL